MEFRRAKESEKQAVLRLYESVKGSEFCVWDEAYPTMNDINADIATDNLYVLCEDGEVIGALSVICDNEMDGLDVWRVSDGTQREVGRIVVSQLHRGRGLARYMVESAIDILRQEGAKALHISAAKINAPALHNYEKLGFSVMGEADMYGSRYCLLEKFI